MFRRFRFPLNRARLLSLAEALKDKDLLIVDVRSPQEVIASSSCPGAVNIPLSEIPLKAAQFGPDKSRPILLYCAKGVRSADAATFLKNIGFTNAFSTTDALSALKLVEESKNSS